MKTVMAVSLISLLTGSVSAQESRTQDLRSMGGGDCRANIYNCASTPNPLPVPDTVWLEEMTWMDVRDALAAGKTTGIIPTGGIEPNGPWLQQASTTMCCVPIATPLRENLAMRFAHRSSNWCLKVVSIPPAVTCEALAP